MIETALKEIGELRDEEFKESASAVRWGRFADDKEWQKMMKPKTQNKKIASAEDVASLFGGR